MDQCFLSASVKLIPVQENRSTDKWPAGVCLGWLAACHGTCYCLPVAGLHQHNGQPRVLLINPWPALFHAPPFSCMHSMIGYAGLLCMRCHFVPAAVGGLPLPGRARRQHHSYKPVPPPLAAPVACACVLAGQQDARQQVLQQRCGPALCTPHTCRAKVRKNGYVIGGACPVRHVSCLDCQLEICIQESA